MIHYTELSKGGNTAYAAYQNLSKSINNAAIITPELTRITDSSTGIRLFYTGSELIMQQLDTLKLSVTDSINIQIAERLYVNIKSELPWLLKSNVPDSILHHNAPDHIAIFQYIDSLISQGITRTSFLIDYRNTKLKEAFNKMKAAMILFIVLSGILLFYTAVNIFRQKSKHEKQFRSLIESSDDIIAMLDENMRPFYRSPSAERLTGFTSADRKEGVKIDEIHPEDQEKINACLLEMRAHPGKAISVTYRMKHKNGHYIWLEGTFTDLFNDPNVRAIVANMRDVTKRREAEQEVIKVYKEKETVLNRINDAVVSVDNEWRYTFLNDAAMVTHPLSKDETLGKVIWDIHPGMSGTIFWEKYHEAMSLRKVVEIEDYYAPMDTWFSVKVYPSSDGLTIFYKDITSGKKAEQELSKSLKEITDYKYALDESSIVAVTDQKGTIKYVNGNFCRISKYSVEELIGQNHRIVNSGYHSKEFIRNIWTTIANGRIWRGELKNKAKDGSAYWVDTTIVPFLNEEGKPYQYVAIRSDITERKKAEYEIIQLNTNLEEKVFERTRELSESKIELTETLERISFLASIADNIQDLVISTDLSSGITRWNDAAEKLLEWKSEEILGRTSDVLKVIYPGETTEQVHKAFYEKGYWQGEAIYHSKSGKPINILATASHLKDNKKI